jgi:hypothetical protein
VKWVKFVFFIYVAMISAAHAQQAAEPQATPTPSPAPADSSYIDAMVTSQVVRLSDSIDSLFGNTAYEDRYNSSTLHVSQTVHMKDGIPGADGLQTSLNLDLPNLKKAEANVRDYFFPPKPAESSNGIVEETKEKSLWDFNQETGVVLVLPVDYFARLRARREFITGEFVHSFYQQVGWSKKKEWESKTSLTSDTSLNRYMLFRFINDLDWEMTNNILGSTHGPSLLYQLSDTRGVSFDFRYGTLIEPDIIYTNRISLGSTYRQETPLQWVFVSVNPEIAWEKDTKFRPLYNFFLTFEFVFGKREG